MQKGRVINESFQKQLLFPGSAAVGVCGGLAAVGGCVGLTAVGGCGGLAAVGVCGGLAAVGACSGRDPSFFNDYPPNPSFLHFGV